MSLCPRHLPYIFFLENGSSGLGSFGPELDGPIYHPVSVVFFCLSFFLFYGFHFWFFHLFQFLFYLYKTTHNIHRLSSFHPFVILPQDIRQVTINLPSFLVLVIDKCLHFTD